MIVIAFLLIVFSALLFSGIINKVKSVTAGRKGPSYFQPVFDIIRLFKKHSIYSTTTSYIFRLAPLVYFATIFTALLFIPFFRNKGLFSFEGDFVVFAYLIGLGRFMMIIAAMDTGSGFEGMGANREALFSLLVEPAFFILLGSLALVTDQISFYSLFNNIHFNSGLSIVIIIIITYVLIQIAMVENSRIPVDDPKTHLELTMIHEVMVLDYCGFDLALIQLTNLLKFSVFGALIANFVIPLSTPLLFQITGFLAVEIIFAVIVGMLESFRARNKMNKNPQWIISLSAIAILVFLAVLILINKI